MSNTELLIALAAWKFLADRSFNLLATLIQSSPIRLSKARGDWKVYTDGTRDELYATNEAIQFIVERAR